MRQSDRIAVLLSPDNSRCNKMHLAADWGIEWRWAGAEPGPAGVMRSRMQFLVGPVWLTAKSWDEDARPSIET